MRYSTDEQEDIERCLNCTKETCKGNCPPNKARAKYRIKDSNANSTIHQKTKKEKVRYTAFGLTYALSEWAEISKVSRQCLYQRIVVQKHSIEECLKEYNEMRCKMMNERFKAYPIYFRQAKYADHEYQFRIETKADVPETLEFVFKNVYTEKVPSEEEWNANKDKKDPAYYYNGYYKLIRWDDGEGYTFVVVKPSTF